MTFAKGQHTHEKQASTEPPAPASDPPPWRGITHRDVPGSDNESRLLNFAMLKRNKWGNLPTDHVLEGEALKAHLQLLTERSRGAARKGWEAQRKARLALQGGG